MTRRSTLMLRLIVRATVVLSVSAAAIVAVIAVWEPAQASWMRSGVSMEPTVLRMEGILLSIGGVAVIVALFWIWTIPKQLGYVALQRSEGEKQTFAVFASYDLQSALAASPMYDLEQKANRVLIVSVSPAGVTFWQEGATPVPACTLPWSSVPSFEAGERSSEIVLGLTMPGEIERTVSLRVRQPTFIGYREVWAQRRDQIVFAAADARHDLSSARDVASPGRPV